MTLTLGLPWIADGVHRQLADGLPSAAQRGQELSEHFVRRYEQRWAENFAGRLRCSSPLITRTGDGNPVDGVGEDGLHRFGVP